MTEEIQTTNQVEYLRRMLAEICDYLPEVTSRKMFGCFAFFARGNIFALVDPPGYIVLKMFDPARYAELLAMPGAEPWQAGGTKMSKWVLIARSLQENQAQLESWVQEAHRQAIANPKPPAKKNRK